MKEAPKGLRIHIAILGRRNSGKSSLINAISGQDVSIVSDNAGTTTDPVEKTLELGKLGPVVLIDTAGVDDSGDLGIQRVQRSMRILQRSDLAILVVDQWGEFEDQIVTELQKNKLPFIICRNKIDLLSGGDQNQYPNAIPVVRVCAKTGAGVSQLIEMLENINGKEKDKPLLNDLLPLDGIVLFVVPLDSGAPKGRLILPQVQAIRDCLDGRKICMVATEQQIEAALHKLKAKPDLVVCDSQVVKQVVQNIPADIPLTTFSILMARFKGELESFANGAAALLQLKPGDKVLIQEACSHEPQEDDIGRIKIPRLLNKLVGEELKYQFAAGKELCNYNDCNVIVHCGACVITKKQMLRRQNMAADCNIPMTNYGMTISLCQGVLPRVLSVFPDALKAFQKNQ